MENCLLAVVRSPGSGAGPRKACKFFRARHSVCMLTTVDTKNIQAVEREVQAIFQALFPEADAFFVSRAFGWVQEWFSGKYPGYLPIDARYHDLEHTMQGTLCLARIFHGRERAKVRPGVSAKMFEQGLLAILLHDTGYLKKTGDTEGTGAKYTLVHVGRSGEFAEKFLSEKGYHSPEISAVHNMIRCTGVNVDLASIPFGSESERIVGYALGTADLLGQMAAADYVEKLPVLFLEFEESARFNGNKPCRATSFASAEDLMSNTAQFWDRYVLPKINEDFEALYRYLNAPWPDGPNFYLQRVEANITRLRQMFPAAA